MDRMKVLRRYNWRLGIAHVIVNGLVLGITSVLLGNGLQLQFRGSTILGLLIVGAIFGLLNFFIRPVIQFLTFPFLFVSLGFVLIVVNAILLLLLSYLLGDIVVINNVFSAFIAGAIVGILSIFLESIFGLTPPIVDENASSKPPAHTPTGDTP